MKHIKNPVGCLLLGLAILILAGAMMGMDLGCSGCPGSAACSDYWKPGATGTAAAMETYGADALHAQLTLIATMQP